MKILKGFLVTVITLVALIIVNMICNVNGINLNTIISGTTTAIVAMFIYEAITKKDRTKK
jgi:hypothetical protein